MTARVRLFVAADVPERHRRHVAVALEPWRARLGGGRWTDPASQHLTLKFLGYAPGDQVEEIADAGRRAARACRAGEIRLSAYGAFPSRKRMRVLWVGVDDPGRVLAPLAGALDEAFSPLGFDPETRPYHPHLTLARFRIPAPFPDDLPDGALADLPPFGIEEAVLYRSHLSPGGARYEPLVSLPVGTGGVDAG